jgi:hypothetical protein
VFGIAVAVAVFAAVGGYASPREFVDGFGPAMAVAAGLAVAGAAAGVALPSRRRGRQSLAASPIPALEGER